jgi:hypothetical protein
LLAPVAEVFLSGEAATMLSAMQMESRLVVVEVRDSFIAALAVIAGEFRSLPLSLVGRFVRSLREIWICAADVFRFESCKSTAQKVTGS